MDYPILLFRYISDVQVLKCVDNVYIFKVDDTMVLDGKGCFLAFLGVKMPGVYSASRSEQNC